MPEPPALPGPSPELGPPDAARLDGHQAPHPDPRPNLPPVRDDPVYRGPPSRAGRGGRSAADGRLLAMPRRGHRPAGRGGALAWTLTGQAAPRSTAHARQHAHAASTARRPLSAASWHERKDTARRGDTAGLSPAGSAPREGGNPLAGVLAAAWLPPRNRCQVWGKMPVADNGRVTCPRCGAAVPQRPGRGRPRRWCSDRCRKAESSRRARRLAARRAAARAWTLDEVAGALAARTWTPG
jgi:hypothetical protein